MWTQFLEFPIEHDVTAALDTPAVLQLCNTGAGAAQRQMRTRMHLHGAFVDPFVEAHVTHAMSFF
jgi:hypothetical protein